MKDSIGLNKVNYVYMASSQNKFVLPDSSIVVNLSKYKKALCSLYKGKKVSYSNFYEDE